MKVDELNEQVDSVNEHADKVSEPKQRQPSKQKRKVIAGCICAALTGILLVGGAVAYQLDSDVTNNTFTIGDVKIKATEPGFPTKDSPSEGRVPGVPDECEMLVPYKTITKDPRIQNVGVNDCVVFFRVTSAVETISLTNDDGSRTENVLDDLFWFKLAGDADSKHENNFNSHWIRLSSLDGEIVDCEGVNEEGRGKTYIFGYYKTLSPSESTDTLFDKVQNKRYGSKTIKANEVEQIKVESFAIQSDEIMRAGIEVPTGGQLTEENLTYIYKVFVNQNEETVGEGAWN